MYHQINLHIWRPKKRGAIIRADTIIATNTVYLAHAQRQFYCDVSTM